MKVRQGWACILGLLLVDFNSSDFIRLISDYLVREGSDRFLVNCIVDWLDLISILNDFHLFE